MNKKFLALMIMSVFVFSLVSVMALPKSPADYNGLQPHGKSDVSHLYLYEKNATWAVVEDGAWGKLTFDSDSFVFNGHGLVSGQSYTLVNHAEWQEGVELGTATADEFGNVHIQGTTNGISGKVWLVLSGDFIDKVTGWHPSEDLFEYNVIPVPTE